FFGLRGGRSVRSRGQTIRGFLFVLTALGSPFAIGAQAVRGTVHASGEGPAIATVSVLLLDLDGRRVASALTDTAGSFLLRAPGPGTFRLKTLRLGFESLTTDPFTLTAADTLEPALRIKEIAHALTAVVTTVDQRRMK